MKTWIAERYEENEVRVRNNIKQTKPNLYAWQIFDLECDEGIAMRLHALSNKTRNFGYGWKGQINFKAKFKRVE